MNNCHRDLAKLNAQQMMALLTSDDARLVQPWATHSAPSPDKWTILTRRRY